MRRKIFVSVLLMASGAFFAQNDVDVMRYSQTTTFGDARFMAMGGAFGSLGANLSCMSFNPAGLALYRNGEIAFSTNLQIQNSRATHYGQQSSDFGTRIGITNTGLAASWEHTNNPYPKSSKLHDTWSRRSTFAFGYNRLADFNRNITLDGQAYNSSIIYDFVRYSQGYTPSKLDPFYEGLAWNTYLTNNVGNDSSAYWGMLDPALPVTVRQSKFISTNGSMGEYNISFAHAMDDKVYFGASLGIPRIRFTYESEYNEADEKDSIFPFKSLKFQENIVTTGNGVNLKVGMVARIGSAIRVGAWAHTPSALTLKDSYQNKMVAAFDTVIGGRTTWSDQSPEGYYRYSVNTPGRLGASVSYIHAKILALSIEGEYVNYPSGKLRDAHGSYNEINRQIRNKYSPGINVRAGAELNVKPVILRAGFSSTGSMFGDIATGKFTKNNFSFGIGFRGAGKWYFDATYVLTRFRENYYLFNPSYVKASDIQTRLHNVVLTVGAKFN